MTPNTIPPITEDDIANYLANTPDFFVRHAGLLGTVQLTSPHGSRAVSLQERQAELLRDKIKGLEQKAVEMIRHGSENSAIADKLQRWTSELLLTRDPRELPWVVVREITAQFQVPQVAVKVWGVSPEFAAEPYAQGASEDVMAFAASLTLPYCGGNPGLEAAQWLDDPKAVASLALIPLRSVAAPQAFGLLVLASNDEQRFAADMGTSFLERIGELTSAALSRLRPEF
ncbi:MAG: hypothetical protein A2W72_17270 [Burkholderiales bacterium RIFCSPLOWO2_12_67_14]|nr:MAG: hypothetical protein A3I64_01345 [Burkholderiales bacterium RIFCSPLOWO2_02_FULL_67_64]OGB36490.1 MAG: hypothetical protein A3E51_14055 [Burkholderiales bacterium RIFCSPHIGHO2_12_FULL_67_38]OGB42901.1 MAG: hypothetical protein A2W72_17270 [Burkholderiales bacterium RIFCSPLOWO2_12_67_14]OGB92535.1 MAG: hypothetical protein A3G82_15975 [Burkholderiales bacterium RIFCSPLOWO2_12_FULL_67_210]